MFTPEEQTVLDNILAARQAFIDLGAPPFGDLSYQPLMDGLAAAEMALYARLGHRDQDTGVQLDYVQQVLVDKTIELNEVIAVVGGDPVAVPEVVPSNSIITPPIPLTPEEGVTP